MRTYILSMCDLRTKKQTTYRCQANTFSEAVTKAQKAISGFPGLSSGNNGGQSHAALNH
ncbi:hypothetical protein [Pseudomonas sp. 2FE]|uniref:hypothetical protein n=1 Tax=Pseudomonas sp. 2FE TaxID=2502190 RepID=UPI001484EB59|nr:hypothetical protein [Pseudomonas sp. 2FE]